MLSIQEILQKQIRKLTLPLRDEEELKAVLKAKLTKKEYKLLQAWAEDVSQDEIASLLHVDETRYSELSVNLVKKLNRETVKQALYLDSVRDI